MAASGTVTGLAWRVRAACRDADPDLFYANRHAQALALCAACTVREECLEDALTREAGTPSAVVGVRGGKTPGERRAMLRGARC